MKKITFMLCLVFAYAGACAQEVKKIKITDLEEYIAKSDHPLIINLWASWCAPCVEEIPWFISTVQQYADRKVELVLVSLDFARDYPDKIVDVIKRKNFKGTFFWLNETKADYFCPKISPKWDGNIPATLIVNNATQYRYFYNRAMTDRQVEAEIKKMTMIPATTKSR